MKSNVIFSVLFKFIFIVFIEDADPLSDKLEFDARHKLQN